MRIDGKKVAVSLGFLIFGAGGAWAADPARSVSVSGACVRGVIPDRGAVVVTVEAKDADAKRTQVAANRQYEALRGKIAGLRLADGEISTVEYVSEEIREWEKDRQVSKGFHTRIGLRAETSDHARLGEVIDVASREGIKQISGLTLFVSMKKMLDEKMACLKEASEQARAKADSLAKALGAKLGEVQTIQENSGPEYAPPIPMAATLHMAKSMAADSAPRMEPGKTEITTTIQVTFGLK